MVDVMDMKKVEMLGLTSVAWSVSWMVGLLEQRLVAVLVYVTVD